MREILYNAALNEAMHEEMSRDDKVYYIGEECAEDTWGTSTGLESMWALIPMFLTFSMWPIMFLFPLQKMNFTAKPQKIKTLPVGESFG